MRAGRYSVTASDASVGQCDIDIGFDAVGYVVQIVDANNRTVTSDAEVSYCNRGTNAPCYCISVSNSDAEGGFVLAAGQTVRWIAA